VSKKEVLMRRTLPFGLICGVAAACSSPSDPFTSGDGYASVQGQVIQGSGASVASSTVFVTCAGGFPPVATPTDASGRYLVNVTATAASLNAGGGQLRCRFTEPDTMNPRAQVDTLLGFTRGPALAALQTVDLHEQSGP
jgi:hypothetical protein